MVRTRRDLRCCAKQVRLFKGERKLRGGISITAAAAVAVANDK